ncbi:MAG: sugar ABC transporter substrate-binding protein [Caldicoprobacterales bacterium]|nr:sugar ABC transporter substrate-binding protein [Clostridiales bacterium]
MIKRLLSLFLVIAVAATLFAACGNGNSSSDEAEAFKENKDIKAKIVVGGWPAGDEAFKAILPGFNEEYPNIEVELNFMQTADHHQQLSTAIAAGSGAPDVAMLEQAWVGRYKDAGGFENLLEAPYNAGSMKEDFVEYKWNLALSVDGKKLVGLVWDIGPATLFYRRDVFQDAGLPSEPEEVEKQLATWEGVLEAAEKVYIPNERWLLPTAVYLYTWNYMNRDFFNEDLELVLDKPGSIEALEAAITMRKNGWDAQLPDMWTNEAQAALASGSVAMVAAGCWYGGFIKSWIAPDTGGLWGVARLPGGIADSNWGGSYLGIPSQSKNKEAAWYFIKYALATKEAQNEMFKAVDYFPGYIPAWDDPMYEEEDSFFGGQKTRALWVDISKSIQPTFSTLMDSTVEGVLHNTVNTGLNEGKSAQEIIEAAKEAIMNETREDYERYIEILKEAGLWDK